MITVVLKCKQHDINSNYALLMGEYASLSHPLLMFEFGSLSKVAASAFETQLFPFSKKKEKKPNIIISQTLGSRKFNAMAK